MRRLSLPCPTCQTKLRDVEISRAEPFKCPHCYSQLKLVFPYEKAILRVVLFVPIILWLAGWIGRKWWGFFLCLLLQFLLVVVMSFVKFYLFPLHLKVHNPDFTKLEIHKE